MQTNGSQATANQNGVLQTRKSLKSMLTFLGFDGFGQFKSELNNVSDRETSGCLVSANWSYTAVAIGSKLCLRGFLFNKPNGSVELDTFEQIQQLAACDRYCLVLLESGKLMKVSPKTATCLEVVKFATFGNDDAAAEPPLKRLNFGETRTQADFRVTHIACGANIACAVSNNNAIFNIPTKIHQLAGHSHVMQLVCGFEHALLLTSNGDVFSWGNGTRGQLGQETMSARQSPCLVEALAGIKITYIAAGGWHSAATSAFGDLYMWGFNTNGQLALRVFRDEHGIKNPSVYPLPQLIDLPNCCSSESINKDVGSCEVDNIFTGTRHTILKMSCGAIYGCGWNAHGQLGKQSNKSFEDEFCRIILKDNKTVLSCGAWSTICK